MKERKKSKEETCSSRRTDSIENRACSFKAISFVNYIHRIFHSINSIKLASGSEQLQN
jgi:hypothetical protein